MNALAVFLVTCAVLVAPHAAAAQLAARYRLVDLSKSVDCQESVAMAVNASGCVLVRDISRTGYRTYLWKPGEPNVDNGTATEITVPNTRKWESFDLNDSGQVLFHRRRRRPIDGDFVLWTPDKPNGTVGQTTDLLSPAGLSRASTLGYLTNDGAVLSECFDDRKQLWIGVAWLPAKPNQPEMRAIELRDRQSGALLGRPVGSNDRGWVIGDAWVGDAGHNLWRPTPEDAAQGTLHRVEPSDPAASGGFNTIAINNKNRLVASFRPGRPRVFQIDDNLRTTQTWIIDAPKPPGGVLDPRRINDQGIVIGRFDSHQDSFVWTADTGARALSGMVKDLPAKWKLLVEDINENGWIVGLALVETTPQPPDVMGPVRHAFLLIPDRSD